MERISMKEYNDIKKHLKNLHTPKVANMNTPRPKLKIKPEVEEVENDL